MHPAREQTDKIEKSAMIAGDARAGSWVTLIGERR